MKLSTALRLSEAKGRCIAFVGAGGKSTAMFQLAHELSPAIVTTSTHIGTWQASLADQHIIWNAADPIPDLKNRRMHGVILVTCGEAENTPGRLQGLSPEQLDKLHDFAYSHSILLVIEADGSHQLPVKAPAFHEPSIPLFTNMVVVVAGLSAIGKPLSSEVVHRVERFSSLGEIRQGDPITPEALASVFIHSEGGLKNIPPGASRIAMLSQADDFNRVSLGQSMSKQLMPAYQAVVITSLAGDPLLGVSERVTPIMVHAVHEPVAGVILAAGGSTRMGRVKPLLEWEGETFIYRIASVSVNAGLRPVIVVTGSEAGRVIDAISDLDLRIANNYSWHSGQGGSVSTGIRALDEYTGAVIFLLADQPQVPVTLLHALVAEHASTMSPIVAPLIDGQRGNPVLFDRSTFPDLINLTGDTGGRALFSRYSVTWVPWHDPRMLTDVDTNEDYYKLKNP